MGRNDIMQKEETLADYFYQWMETFKKPALAPVTYVKYQNTYRQIQYYFNDENIHSISRLSYQQALNKFAKTHAKRTTAGFHKQIRAAILDAVEEGLISTDFTRKAIITGRKNKKKQKFLSYTEWQKLITYTSNNCTSSLNLIIYLSAVTGMRYAEVLGLTVADIDFKNKTVTINKTWDYKYHTGFKRTKNRSSIRTIDLDRQTLKLLRKLLVTRKLKKEVQQICVDSKGSLPVSATINRYLENLCQELEIPIISFHGLRHTHASILLFKGVNLISVSKRLGHKDVTTTQSVYFHVIKEMEERETDLILSILDEAIK